MTNHTKPEPTENHLATLGAHLAARGFVIELVADALHVTNPEADGVSDTITCRPREEDCGRPWLRSSSGEPIAKADHITDVTTWIMGRLAARHIEASG